MGEPRTDLYTFSLRTLVVVGITALVATVLLLAWSVSHVLLLIFAGALLAVFLRGVARFLHRHAHLPWSWSLALVIGALLVLLIATAWTYGPSIAQGIDDLVQRVIEAVEALRSRLHAYPWGRKVLEFLAQRDASMPNVVPTIMGIFSSALGGITAVLAIFFFGVYISADPDLYARGLVRLVPPRGRDRAREVLAHVERTLRWWLVGRLSSMALVGLLTWAGLLVLQIPLATTLAIVAALLSFVPYIGPIVSAVPAILVALGESPHAALSVLALYIAIQTIESYLITPLIQERAVSIPPALLLGVQLIMGLLFGILGVLIATPFAAAMLVLVNTLYVDDVLENSR